MSSAILFAKRSTLHTGVLLTVLLLMFLSRSAGAADVQVHASIPYPAPSQPATFDTGLDGTTVQDALVTLSGTCQVQNPADAVVIQRSGTTLGSTACTSGTFSLQIMLSEGLNTLIAKTINASMIEGPDSQPIQITLVLPPTVTPAPATPAPTASPTPEVVTEQTNAGAAAELIATPSEPFSVLTTDNQVTISLTVGGGSTPYTILLNWGDGTTESHTVDQAGEYQFSHTYTAKGTYLVRGSVHDVLGAETVFEYAAMSAEKSPTTSTGKTTGGGTTAETVFDRLRRYAKPAAGVASAAAVLGAGYWFGAHHAAAQVLRGGRATPQQTTRSTPKVKNRSAKKPVRRRR